MFKTILGPAQVNSGENTEINKQSHVKFWMNLIKYGTVSYSLSCIICDSVFMLTQDWTNYQQFRQQFIQNFWGFGTYEKMGQSTLLNFLSYETMCKTDQVRPPTFISTPLFKTFTGSETDQYFCKICPKSICLSLEYQN